MTNLEAAIALSLLPSSLWVTAAERLRLGQSIQNVLHQLLAERESTASDAELPARAAALASRGRRAGLTPILRQADEYPALLDLIPDPPFVLWLRGVKACLAEPGIAIVGSRAASPYAVTVASKLAGDLASRGVTIISGLARGVDSAAHRGALESRGATVAVLGCGADVIYPSEHRSLAREIEATGAIVSELAPGTPPKPHFFPLRNRIISGLALAVVVVEAGEKSGSLITARAALEQGRDVLAVPGNVLCDRNRGAHALLRDGAKIVETADDILEDLGWPGSLIANQHRPQGGVARVGASLNDDGTLNALLESLVPGEASDLDGIAKRSGLALERLLPQLLELELQGRLRRVDGGRFLRI
jgi:DNA processing protein